MGDCSFGADELSLSTPSSSRRTNMTFSHAYLEEIGSGRLRIEETLVRSELERLGLDFSTYTKKRIQRRQLPLTRSDFIVGDIDCMQGAMRQLGIELPELDDYPDALAPFLHRKTWPSTVQEVLARIGEDHCEPFFVKPARRRKLFTGCVVSGPNDMHKLDRVSRIEPVICAEVVQWISEFRVFVTGCDVVAVDHYAGDPSRRLDLDTIRSALTLFAGRPGAPAACGLDFGVLATGETALVEANDGFALGAYHVSAEPYFQVLTTRWTQLLRT